MPRFAESALILVMLAGCLVSGCQRHTKAELYLLAHAKDLVQRHDRSRKPTTIELASLSPDRKSICGLARIGERRHVPYIIKHTKPLPGGAFVQVDLVLTVPPYKGAPVETQAAQAHRILSECWALGHRAPPLRP